MRPRWVVPVLVGAALVLVALAARGNSPVVYGARLAPPVVPTRSAAPAEDDLLASDGVAGVVGGSVVVVLIVLFVLLSIASLGVVLFMVGPRRRRVRRGHDAVADTAEEAADSAPGAALMLTGARKALAELRERHSGPPSDAVIAAWLNLEDAAARSGAPKQEHETSTEFTGALLVRYEVDTAAAATLRGLYHRARFGPAARVSTQDAEDAAEALERVVVSLDRG
ncbi:DUF4129 domain-containing protein [Umezawaea sp. Da 62-37]|uniref:DUF4129 domain-containing protein n=1 Tax=Umezawaea sp. Da 62-37 TaxID=3075927 RepID=UPI0028F6EF03|nr:DUF4129 domain-containing protein [Umezawaea sp. Da 62-37]WNV82310.1 DUF4129 domain-containing protein [Umezawaea sp. Da 62-37]